MSLENVAQAMSRPLVAITLLGALTAGCGSSGGGQSGVGGGSVGTGGTGGNLTGTGGHLTGTGGHLAGTGGQGTGGTTGAGGDVVVDAGPVFPNCTPLHAETTSILDFNTVSAGSTQAAFGAFGSTFSGGTYEYPASSGPADAGNVGLSSDFSGGNWHLTGLVGTYSGFGLYLTCKSNVAAFTGLAFDIAGTFTATDGSADAGALEPRFFMGISTPADELDSAHASNPPTWGTCGGTCVAPSRVVVFGSSNVTVTTPWTSFTGGFPVDSINPAEILSIFFTLPWNGGSPSPYIVDLTIDNIRFTTQTAVDASSPTDTGAERAAPADAPADGATDASD